MPFMPPVGHFFGSKKTHSRDSNRGAGSLDPRSQFHPGRQARSARHDRRMADAEKLNEVGRLRGISKRREAAEKKREERKDRRATASQGQVTRPTSLSTPSRAFDPNPNPVSTRMALPSESPEMRAMLEPDPRVAAMQQKNRRDFQDINRDASGSQARAGEAARMRANQFQQLGNAGPMGVFTGINSFSPRMPWTPETLNASMANIPGVNDAANFVQGVQANNVDRSAEAGRQYHRNLQGITDRYERDMNQYRQFDATDRAENEFYDRMAGFRQGDVRRAEERVDEASRRAWEIINGMNELPRELGEPTGNPYMDFMYRLGNLIVPDQFKFAD